MNKIDEIQKGASTVPPQPKSLDELYNINKGKEEPKQTPKLPDSQELKDKTEAPKRSVTQTPKSTSIRLPRVKDVIVDNYIEKEIDKNTKFVKKSIYITEQQDKQLTRLASMYQLRTGRRLEISQITRASFEAYLPKLYEIFKSMEEADPFGD